MIKKYLDTIPKQHGVWYIFSFSYLVGAVIFYDNPVKLLWLFLLSVFGIFSYNSLVINLKEFKIKGKLEHIYPLFVNLFVSGAFALFILLKYKFYYLIFLGFVVFLLIGLSLYLIYIGKELAVSNEVLSILSVSIVVIFIGLISGKFLFLEIINLWFFTLLFFLSSIFRVRYLVRERKILNKEFVLRFKKSLWSLVFHLLLIVLAMIVSFFFRDYTSVSIYFFTAFIPVFLRAIYIMFKKYPIPPDVRKIGYSEVANSLIFLILIILVYKV